MTDARTLRDALRSLVVDAHGIPDEELDHWSVVLAEAAAAEADTLRERVAVLRGALDGLMRYYNTDLHRCSGRVTTCRPVHDARDALAPTPATDEARHNAVAATGRAGVATTAPGGCPLCGDGHTHPGPPDKWARSYHGQPTPATDEGRSACNEARCVLRTPETHAAYHTRPTPTEPAP